MTEAAIDAGFLGDRYVSLGEPVTDKGDAGAWSVRVYVKPFVDWIWGGCLPDGAGRLCSRSSDRRYRFAVRQKLATLAGAVRPA